MQCGLLLWPYHIHVQCRRYSSHTSLPDVERKDAGCLRAHKAKPWVSEWLFSWVDLTCLKIHTCAVFCIVRNLYNCVTVMANFEGERSPGLKSAGSMLVVSPAAADPQPNFRCLCHLEFLCQILIHSRSYTYFYAFWLHSLTFLETLLQLTYRRLKCLPEFGALAIISVCVSNLLLLSLLFLFIAVIFHSQTYYILFICLQVVRHICHFFMLWVLLPWTTGSCRCVGVFFSFVGHSGLERLCPLQVLA